MFNFTLAVGSTKLEGQICIRLIRESRFDLPVTCGTSTFMLSLANESPSNRRIQDRNTTGSDQTAFKY